MYAIRSYYEGFGRDAGDQENGGRLDREVVALHAFAAGCGRAIDTDGDADSAEDDGRRDGGEPGARRAAVQAQMPVEHGRNQRREHGRAGGVEPARIQTEGQILEQRAGQRDRDQARAGDESVGGEVGAPRITSYNVCYTKLLRSSDARVYFADTVYPAGGGDRPDSTAR